MIAPSFDQLKRSDLDLVNGNVIVAIDDENAIRIPLAALYEFAAERGFLITPGSHPPEKA